MNVLISVDPLTDLVGDLLQDNLGAYAFDGMAVTIVREAIAYFNGDGVEEAFNFLIDTFVQKGLWTAENIPKVDAITAMFEAMFDLKDEAVPDGKTLVEYDRVGNQAIVRTIPPVKPPDKYLADLKEEFDHALERNDFFSERMRRAFDEISR
jgi:hypothetical protein